MIERVDEHFQADREKRKKQDEELVTDGGEPALDADAEIHVSHAAKEGSLKLLLRACDISGPSRERAFLDEIDSIEELVDYHAEHGDFTAIYGVGPAKNRKLCAAVEMISKTPEESEAIVTDGGVDEMPAPVYETKTIRVHEPDRGQYIFLMLTRFDGLQQSLFAEIGYTSTYIQFATMSSGSHNRDADTDPFAIARRRDDDFKDTNAFDLMYALDSGKVEWDAIEDGDRLTEVRVQELVTGEDEVPDEIVTDGGEDIEEPIEDIPSPDEIDPKTVLLVCGNWLTDTAFKVETPDYTWQHLSLTRARKAHQFDRATGGQFKAQALEVESTHGTPYRLRLSTNDRVVLDRKEAGEWTLYKAVDALRVVNPPRLDHHKLYEGLIEADGAVSLAHEPIGLNSSVIRILEKYGYHESSTQTQRRLSTKLKKLDPDELFDDRPDGDESYKKFYKTRGEA